jgi:MIP family channel proteins
MSVKSLVAEAVGTFLFFFIGAGAALSVTGDPNAATLIIAAAHGLALAVMVSALGAVSGGHFNPAVTFGLWVAGKVGLVKGASYMVAQLVGGAAAGYALVALVGPVGAAVPALGADVTANQGVGIEAILTAGLLLAVFGTAVDPRGPKIGGLAIGLAVFAGILMGGGLTGGAMNPARWFGMAVWDGPNWANAWVWIIGPLVGAAIVGLLYRFLWLPKESES